MCEVANIPLCLIGLLHMMAILIIIIIFRKPPTPFSLGMSPGCRSPEGLAHAENDLIAVHFDLLVLN